MLVIWPNRNNHKIAKGDTGPKITNIITRKFPEPVDLGGREVTVPIVQSLVKAASIEGGVELIATRQVAPRTPYD